MNVLSLFDGMSCGRIALEQLNIKVDKYYACEIDKFAMQISNKNYPDIIQLGDVSKVKGMDLDNIDLLIGGSPCQGFSFAGKQLAFDDPRSQLFFEFIRLKEECNPKYFLLENVRMKREHEDIISEYTGFEPIMINSSKLSAQNRVRLYWTNIPNVKQPIDKGIILKDILEDNKDWGEQPSYLKNEWNGIPRGKNVSEVNEKGSCLTASMYKGQVPLYVKKDNKKEELLKSMTNQDGKSYCITASYLAAEPKNSLERKQRTMIPVDKDEELPSNINLIYDNEGKSHKPIKVGMNIEQVKVRKNEVNIKGLQHLLREMKSNSGKTNQQIAEAINISTTKVEHWFRTDNSFSIPSDDIWLKLKKVLDIKIDDFDKSIMEFEYKNGVYESKQRVYSENGKSPTLTASNNEQFIETKPKQVGVAVDIKGHDQIKRVYSPDGKSPTVTTCSGGHREPKIVAGAFRGRFYKDGVRQDQYGSIAGKSSQMLELRKDKKTNTVTTVQKDNVLTKDDIYWRKLTPIECERLQTVPDNYTDGVSNSQRYKMLGNGWTVEVIKHIFKNMLDNAEPEKENFKKQLNLF